MKIVKRGNIPTITKTFTCDYCGTVFEADNKEFRYCDQLSYLHDGLEYECQCPVCNRWVFIRRQKKET